MKEKAINDYIKEYPQIHDWLYFNVVLESPGNTSVITDSDNVLQEMIDGSKEREYLFSIAMIQTYDEGTSDTNMEALEETKKLMDWVHENNKNSDYPKFPDNCIMDDVEVLTEVPQLTIDIEHKVSRYLISMRVPYIERST